MMIKKVIGFAIFVCFLTSCDSNSASRTYYIGRDPTWFPSNLSNKTNDINAFTNALAYQIGIKENVNFQIIDRDWNSLFLGLNDGDYQGVFSSLPPTVENLEKYDFSEPFIQLGPVLVLPVDSKAQALEDLKGKIVGISPFDRSVLIVQKYPSIFIKTYENMPEALEDLAQDEIDGVLLSSLEAHALVPDLYASVLRIASSPLNNEGLRLLCLKEEEKHLIKIFNTGLKKLQKTSLYKLLRAKYSVY